MAYEPVVLAHRNLSMGQAQITEWQFPTPLDISVSESSHMIELSLPPLAAGGSARFPDFAPNLSAPIGAVVMRPAGVKIRASSRGGHIQVARLVVRPEDYALVTERELSFDEATLSTAVNMQDHLIRALLIGLRQELLSPQFSSDILLDAYAISLMVNTARCLGRSNECIASVGRLVPWQEKRVRERLNEEPPPRLAELAELCGVSIRHFARLYKGATGEPVTETIARLQIQRAREGLTSTELPIKAIASQLGFASTNAFGAAFKRATGLTPSEYRQLCRRRTFAVH